MLEARGLTKSYGGKRVVDGLDLDVGRGEVLGLLGPNGAGKTTALRMLYGFTPPEAGRITYDGRDFALERTELERLIGVCTQDDTLDEDFSVAQNLRVYAGYFRPRVKDIAARVETLISRFGLEAHRDAPPSTLSGGYKQRLLIARSIVHEPAILFLDEPTTGLDPVARVELWRLVDELRAEGLAIVLTTHYMDEAERLSDRLCVLQRGRAVARGRPSDVLGELVGEQIMVVDRGDPHREDLARFFEARNLETHAVLGEIRAALRPADHVALEERFSGMRFRLRDPNLDDLFLLLSSRRSADPAPSASSMPSSEARGEAGGSKEGDQGGVREGSSSMRRGPAASGSEESEDGRPRFGGRWLQDMRTGLDWRSAAVLRRNALVYLRNWRTAFLPPALEPVVYLLAIGIGLDRYVAGLEWGGRKLDYPNFVGPGLLAYTAFVTPFYESLYSAYVRMVYQRTWDGILATQVELPHLVWGEILWSATRGLMNAAAVSAVLAAFTAAGILDLHVGGLVALLPVVFFAGLGFAAAGLIFTAIVPAIDHMNYPVFLIGLPISFFSNTFFPVDIGALDPILHVNPVFQLAELCRSVLVLGTPSWHLAGFVVASGALLALLAPLAIKLSDRRIHREG